jgi:hypothetical protein
MLNPVKTVKASTRQTKQRTQKATVVKHAEATLINPLGIISTITGLGAILQSFRAKDDLLNKALTWMLRIEMAASLVLYFIGRHINHKMLKTILEHPLTKEVRNNKSISLFKLGKNGKQEKDPFATYKLKFDKKGKFVKMDGIYFNQNVNAAFDKLMTRLFNTKEARIAIQTA